MHRLSKQGMEIGMKSIEKFYIVIFTFIIVAFLTASELSTLTYGGTNDGALKANAIKSMINGINSTNTGLAQSSICLAGYHKYTWAVEPLINMLNDSTKETSIRVLAAYSLNMIGDEKGMQAVRMVSFSENNYILKSTCGFIYKNYSERKIEVYSIDK
jgi:hypothetical protein